jgi:hypothetical protein
VRHRVSGLPAPERPEWRHGAEEDVLTGYVWPPSGEIGQQGVTHVLWKRQPNLSTSLTRHSDRGGLETQIREAQTRHVTGAQPETDQ